MSDNSNCTNKRENGDLSSHCWLRRVPSMSSLMDRIRDKKKKKQKNKSSSTSTSSRRQQQQQQTNRDSVFKNRRIVKMDHRNNHNMESSSSTTTEESSEEGNDIMVYNSENNMNKQKKRVVGHMRLAQSSPHLSSTLLEQHDGDDDNNENDNEKKNIKNTSGELHRRFQSQWTLPTITTTTTTATNTTGTSLSSSTDNDDDDGDKNIKKHHHHAHHAHHHDQDRLNHLLERTVMNLNPHLLLPSYKNNKSQNNKSVSTTPVSAMTPVPTIDELEHRQKMELENEPEWSSQMDMVMTANNKKNGDDDSYYSQWSDDDDEDSEQVLVGDEDEENENGDDDTATNMSSMSSSRSIGPKSSHSHMTNKHHHHHNHTLVRIYDSLLSIVLWFIMLIWYIPSLFQQQAPVSKNVFSVRNDKVHLHEKKSTGLIQDIALALMDFTDSVAQSLRLLIRFQYVKCWKQVKFSFSLFRLSRLLSTEQFDDRTVAQVIIDEGFPHESVRCETQDGYVLHMDRIPNRKARKVIYFQHGILDSAFAWVGNGVSHSIALRAYSSKDVDVFLGNFRGFGLGPSQQQHLETTELFDKRNYWDYSFNEHAFYDVRAFVNKIREIKCRELKKTDKDNGGDGDDSTCPSFTINVVAHSLGAGCILAYLVQSQLTHQPHHLDNVMLLAPSGIHQKIPLIANVLSAIGMPIVKRLVPYVGITTREKKVLFAKILQDLNNHPALRALMAVAVSKLLLGGPVEDSPFQYVHNLLYQSYNGTSVKVADHLMQMKRSGKFMAYDYGSAQLNRQHYGQDTPWNFLEHYKDIDPIVPIHIMYGDDDRIIPPHNILTHAHELKLRHGNMIHVKKFVNCGHLELTLGMNVHVIHYILRNIK